MMSEIHQAAVWAEKNEFSKEHLDCITTVMLKILDGKCKMNRDEQNALFAIYDITCSRRGVLFDNTVHKAIEGARRAADNELNDRIHELRLAAEAAIPKPVMKGFKAMMRSALNSLDSSQH